MSNQTPKWNNELPVTHYTKRGVDIPLDQAMQNPSSVMNTTQKTYLPAQPNQLPPLKK